MAQTPASTSSDLPYYSFTPKGVRLTTVLGVMSEWSARQNRVKKRSLQVVNEHSERGFNTAIQSAVGQN
jgi:DNA-binding HxlR family transcriptional regulator